MSKADAILNLFDGDGRYTGNDGEVAVIFLTQSSRQCPGKMRFKDRLLVGVELDGDRAWTFPGDSPLSLNFRLDFPREGPLLMAFEQGRVVVTQQMPLPVSKEKFLANFRRARTLRAHPRVVADSPGADVAAITSDLIGSALWLTPRSVERFNVALFPELGTLLREELEKGVQEFRAVASQVPADKPPTTQQYDDAATAFSRIITVLAPYLPTSGESAKVEQALRNLDLPSWVLNWDYELGSSADGDPAIWVIFFLGEDVDRNERGRFGLRMVPTIREALQAEGVNRWPYIRFRSIAEARTA